MNFFAARGHYRAATIPGRAKHALYCRKGYIGIMNIGDYRVSCSISGIQLGV